MEKYIVVYDEEVKLVSDDKEEIEGTVFSLISEGINGYADDNDYDIEDIDIEDIAGADIGDLYVYKMSEILDGIKKDYADINDAKEEMNRIENNKILDFDDISNYLDDCDNYVDDFIIS